MKFWLLLLSLVAACAGSVVGWWQRDHDRWRPPAPSRPAVPTVQSLPEPQPVSLAAAIERPLLWSSRRPPRPRVQEDRLVDELNRSRLLAVLQSGEQRIALLRAPDGRLIQYGSQSQPWRLESFDGRRASFVTEEGQRASRPLEPIRGR